MATHQRVATWMGIVVAAALALPGCGGLTRCNDGRITTQSVPDGALGVAYSFVFAHSCGSAGASWEVSDGQLPPSLTLSWDGRLSGVPIAAGAFAFHVRVTFTDRGWGAATYTSGSDTRAFTVDIRQ